jgi:hypothetical protein
MKNEKYGLTNQKHDDQVVALELLLFGYACASLHDLNKLRQKLRQTEKKLRKAETNLRFSVQTEKIGPLSIIYDENMRKMKNQKMTQKTISFSKLFQDDDDQFGAWQYNASSHLPHSVLFQKVPGLWRYG